MRKVGKELIIEVSMAQLLTECGNFCMLTTYSYKAPSPRPPKGLCTLLIKADEYDETIDTIT